jgi:hypothetical protein
MPMRLALLACVGCAAVLGGVLWRALQLDPIDAPSRGTGEAEWVDDAAPSAAYPLERVLAAVAKDPFHPERRRPGARFQLPADLAADGGGFAMCAWAGGSPRIVRVGEHAGEWVLKRVTQGAAEFTTPAGQSVVVRIPKAGS